MKDSYLAKVRFIFPFRLGLADSGYGLNMPGDVVHIRVWSGRAIAKVEYRSLEERDKEHPGEWLRARHSPSDVVNRMLLINEHDDLYVEELRDTSGFTRIDVIFERKLPIPAPKSKKSDDLIAYAILCAQRFIRIYRDVTHETDVTVPQISDSPVVEVAVAEKYTCDPEQAEGYFRHLTRNFNWRHPQATGLLKDPLTPKEVEVLGKRLRSGEVPELHMELLLEAKHLAQQQHNYRLSVMVSQTALEYYVQMRLRLECHHRSIATLALRNGTMSGADDAITYGELGRDLLDRYAKCLAGHSVKSSKAYNAWHQYAYKLRNEIVHAGRTDVTETQAIKAFDAVIAFANDIDTQLIKSRAAT